MRSEFTALFVGTMPDRLAEGALYVSVEFCTAIHLCACGCGSRVVTPLTPAGWALIFDGETVSLYPSIGNWNLPCRSHYWIERNRVKVARRWSEREIAAGRLRDASLHERHFRGRPAEHDADQLAEVDATKPDEDE